MKLLRFALLLLALPCLILLRLLGWRRRSSGAVAPENARLVAAEEAAARELCLGALQMRLELEMQQRRSASDTEQDVPQPAAAREALNDWLRSESLWPRLSRAERRWLERPLGGWSEQDCRDVSWREEARAMLAWALGRLEVLPAYDQEVERGQAARQLPMLASTGEHLRGAALRPEAEIRKARDTAELWLWRARTSSISKDPAQYPPPEGFTYEKIIAMTVEQAAQEGLFVPIQGDFPALGKRYAELTEEELSTLTSIATERLHGLNWLCGYAADWDQVPHGT